MANKKTKKKSEQTTAAASSAKAEAKKAEAKKADKKSEAKKAAPAKKDAKGAKKSGKPGFITRVKNYFAAVRSEMKRVVWPSKSELTNYSVAVILSLIVVGVVIAGLDAIISGGLVLIAR